MRGVWNHRTVGWVIGASLLPVITALVLDQGPEAVLRLGLCGAVVLFWQLVFRHSLGVPMTATGAVTAVAVALLAPLEAPLWQIVLAVSFGVVVGELLFGGWGRGFLSAGVVSLAFLSLSLPAASYETAGPLLALGVLAALVILLVAGIVAVPVILASIAGFGLVFFGAGLSTGAEVDLLAASGGLCFALVYLVADPVASAATPWGRWLYGGLAGALTGLLMASNVSVTQTVVFATLLASIFAPLIDQGVIMAQIRLRKKRYG